MTDDSASTRIRGRLKDELRERDISQRELADKLTRDTGVQWNQAKIGKVLNGDVELKVDDLDAIARSLGIFISEAVRDRGLEFYAEMTPTALRMLTVFRQKPLAFQQAIQILHGIMPAPVAVPKTDEPARPKRGRPQNAELAKRLAK